MEIIKTTALITINETLWVQLIGFLVFLFIINRVMFRPVRRNMAARETHFSGLADDIAALKAELETMVATTRADEWNYIQQARQEGETRRQAGKQAAEAVIARTRAEIEARKRASRKHLDATLAAARQDVVTESHKVAREVIQRLLAPEAVP